MSRELIVFGPADDPRLAEQLEAVEGDRAGAEERQLTVLPRAGDTFRVELCVHGAVQARWEDVVGVDELWARIDALPARRRELRQHDLQDRRSDAE